MLNAFAITFRVVVPEGTKSCYIAGDFNGWDAGNAYAMTATDQQTYTITLDDVTPEMAAKGYKYLSGPSWDYVEKGASGEELSNRTTVGNPDKVARWAKVYDPDVLQTTRTLNSYPRIVRILLPQDYANSDKRYPVVYLTGVQARYDNAGSDEDRGDDHFGATSWNLSTIDHNACILVSVYGFVPEMMFVAHPDYAGSGQAASFLNSIAADLIPYINSTYRTLTGPANTSIVSADMGGMLALYAALHRPDVFGQCAVLSPVIWQNRKELLDFISTGPSLSGHDTQRFHLSVGSAEIEEVKTDVADLHEALQERTNTQVRQLTVEGAQHNDSTWGKVFSHVLPYLLDGNAPETSPVFMQRSPVASKVASDITQNTYSLHSAIDSQTLEYDPSTSFSLVTDYLHDGTAVTAQVAMKEIPTAVKTQYYWNVSRGANGTGDMLKTENGNIGFSSKKAYPSWHRIVILEDETVKDIAANSARFRLITSAETITMTNVGNYTVEATATFTSPNKTFSIHYGSVNSGSDMGAITPAYQVSAQCTEAKITYDFRTNKVNITETQTGESIGAITVERFMAVPSICRIGSKAKVTLHINDLQGCIPSVSVSHNYGESITHGLTVAGTGQWTLSLNDLKGGIYHISLHMKRGDTELNDLKTIAIKVIEGTERDKQLINPYQDIDWNTIQQYKANFHTHSTWSFDGHYHVDETVQKYHQAGYKILALTEHDANPYPWHHFPLYQPQTIALNPIGMDMLTLPGNELSKNFNNSWNEVGGSEFNHHNDFFTGRQGQEFATLRESYAYTQSLGGMQLINHPGQYWNLNTYYTAGAKNSPEWHAENFRTYHSLIGLEVYNQGDKRPNDRILWDQILELTMPETPVYGYSCDDTHTLEQFFRNYNWMLMPQLTTEALKDAMTNGHHYFCYEYTGSGEGKTPRIQSISTDAATHTITIQTDAKEVYWISATDISQANAPATRKSTILAVGNQFDYTGFQGRYVRALLVNEFGETCTQPFGFTYEGETALISPISPSQGINVYPNPMKTHAEVRCAHSITHVRLINLMGQIVYEQHTTPTQHLTLRLPALLPQGQYILSATTTEGVETLRIIKK